MLKNKNLLWKWLPLLLILVLLLCVFYFRLNTYFNFETLRQYHQFLLEWTNQHYGLAVISFVTLYVISVTLSIPGAVFLTITGGYLFGVFWGTLCVIFSATIGATLLFLAVKTALGTWLENLANPWIKKMEQGFQRNAFYYLLTLRLIPAFPFWLVNIVPALLNVRLAIFILATLIGIIPGTFVYVSLGNGLSYFFESQQVPSLNIILTPPILLPLIGLALLSLLPVLYQHFKRKKHEKY